MWRKPPVTHVEKKIRLLEQRIPQAMSLLESCVICPRECRVNRIQGEKGACRVANDIVVSTASLHFGEEPPISGRHGSGTVFFSSCNLRCLYCQNYTISQEEHGQVISPEELARQMLSLQKRGAHNINLVTPTHLGPQIMAALLQAYRQGLDIPLVYNCGGYESLEMLRLWEDIVDIYMPDMKYGEEDMSSKYSSAPDYPQANRRAVLEMYRQVGDLKMDPRGVAVKGLLIRHLVLPNGIAGSETILRFIAEEISTNTFVSLMSQYFPQYKADEFPELNRRITRQEYARVKEVMQKLGLTSGWQQNVPIDPDVFSIRRILQGDNDN
jgi:putative pyruvate formate lyase activating enzyme